MGKRKVPKNQATPFTSEDATQGKKEDLKGKKTYSLQQKAEKVDDASSDLPKVRLPEKLEYELISLILDQKNNANLGDVSKRITSKKLTDVYNSLSDAGFSRSQVESAMTNTIMLGGDLIDALDWLCLNTQNDQLPSGFSETLLKEEEKHRPKFDASLQVEATQIPHKTTNKEEPAKKMKAPAKAAKAPAMKNWILAYAEQDSSDEGDADGLEGKEEMFDPNVRYSSLFWKMQDLKDQAAIAKSNGATEKHKNLSKQLREMHLEMSSLEKYPDFHKATKSQLKAESSERPKAKEKKEPTVAMNGPSAPTVSSPEAGAAKISSPKDNANDSDGEDGFGLNLFAEPESKEDAASATTVAPRVQEDVRSFEYTRSQWTGKSPKQFLIDWVRKHLTKSGPPKFRKVQIKVNRFKATAVVDTKDRQLSVTPEILCENFKEAEHLAATLALYNLCKGQAVHQLLPPTYRNVWVEWMDEEQAASQQAKEKENKPRDQFISKLIKGLKLDAGQDKKDKKSPPSGAQGGADDDEEDDWEALADKEQLPEIVTMSALDDEEAPVKQPEYSQANKDSPLLRKLQARQGTSEYQELLKTRQQLPVYKYKDKILNAVRKNSVVVIAGETGSGKSTQVPQFILEDLINQGHPSPNIICTEPRRISATSLAKRVSQEMGEGGSRANEAMVGYHIRFESHRGPNTRLIYCTTGVVLRQIQGQGNLDGITHLIIDEVHERNVQSDFLMIVVKNILARRLDLKVILMSATLDSKKFSAYFHHCPVIDVPGKAFPVEVFHLEDVVEMTGYVVDEDSPYTLRGNALVQEQSAKVEVTLKGGDSSKRTVTWTQEDISRIDRTDLPADKYSLRTRNAVSRLNLSRINLDLIVDLLKHLNVAEQFCQVKGAVLIFLPGLADIQELYEMLNTDRHFSDTKKYKIYALHSVLSSQDQSLVFSVPPPGIRKVVLATNIAETGITIPDVVFVIDSGKAKENRYMEASQISALEEVFISKANSKQRAGRAGRVREGFCFKMFTAAQHKEFKAYATPELLRVPLEELCLNIMKCKYGKPYEFLSGALDPPLANSVARAMSLLREVGACLNDEVTLTPLGQHLALLPVDVRIGKMLLFGAIFGCLEPVAVIAAAMTDKSPFVVPLSKRSEADAAKLSLAVASSDHITLYKAFQGWTRARQENRSSESSYLNKHFLKRSTLMDIENVKKDLMKLMSSIGFSTRPEEFSSLETTSADGSKPSGVLSISKAVAPTGDLDSSTIAMIKAVLTAGLYPQVGKVLTAPSIDVSEMKACFVETSQGTTKVHPSSVNRCLDMVGAWMVYQEKVRLSQVYLRDTSLVSPYVLLLFGGAIDVQHTKKVVSLDGWIKFKAVAKAGVIFKELRVLLNLMLEKKLKDPSMNITGSPLITLLKEVIRSGSR